MEINSMVLMRMINTNTLYVCGNKRRVSDDEDSKSIKSRALGKLADRCGVNKWVVDSFGNKKIKIIKDVKVE
jgi:hypothetical protein